MNNDCLAESLKVLNERHPEVTRGRRRTLAHTKRSR